MAGIDLQEHRRQVEAYLRQRGGYVEFARVLRRVLEEGCKRAFPQAMVQTRAKDVRSFAEKAARKFEKYRDPVHQMTDLCGGRVTVQTLEQVKAVREFIEANFRVLEKDDKSAGMAEDRFGYRDVHYIVQLRADRLAISAQERAAIGARAAEVQVRTWVQHAWADTLHDRIYKTKLRLSPETKRTGNLLAAVLEESDRAFDRLASEVDGMLANYSAHAPREDVEKEVSVISAVLANLPAEAGEDERAGLMLRLARLVASALGDYARVVQILEPVEKMAGPLRREVLTEQGHALCKVWRHVPESEDYRRGQVMLQEALALGAGHDGDAAVDARKSRSLQARGWTRLAWSWEPVEEKRAEVLACYRKALELEPANPYYLADILGFEFFATQARELAASTRIAVGRAIEVCRQHALAGIEMPYACFTAGRLSLLLEEGAAALEWYARGLCHCRQETACVPGDVLDNELVFVRRLHGQPGMGGAQEWVRDLLIMARTLHAPEGPAREALLEQVRAIATAGERLKLPAVIVAGGASSLAAGQLGNVQELLVAALGRFHGTVISGGTTVGVPGCVGAAAKALQARGKAWELVGYLPERVPVDVVKDERYDRLVLCGESFSAEQILLMWADLALAGVQAGEVQLLGFGGGTISALEYRIGLALGAQVGLVLHSGGAAEALLTDELWAADRALLPLPADGMTLRAFVQAAPASVGGVSPAMVEEMGREFHGRHLARRIQLVPENLRPWEELDETYKKASREQARYAIEILEAAGFGVRAAAPGGPGFRGFSHDELERLAELEHGRWNVERLRTGWRPGEVRDNVRKVHPLIAPWGDRVLDRYREDDFDAVRAMPEILAKAGLEVYRKS